MKSIYKIIIWVELFVVEEDRIKRRLLLASIIVQTSVHFEAEVGEYHNQPKVQNHAPGENAEHFIKLDGA